MSRNLAALLVVAALIPASPVKAEDWPTRPLTMVNPFAAGGPNDVMARLFAQRMGEILGQPVIVENIGGAGGMNGADRVAKAAPDGYTMLLATTGLLTVNPTIYHAMPFSPSRDLAPVARLATVPNLMVINPDLPVHTVAEFIAYAKARPGKVFFGSPGSGTGIHLSGELFNLMAGVEMVHAPYRGSAPALADLMAGQIQVMFDNMPSALPLARSGRLRALAVTTAKRAPMLSLALTSRPAETCTKDGRSSTGLGYASRDRS